MSTEGLLIGGAVFVSLYVLIRLFLARRQPNPVDAELSEVLNNDQYKVKGRTATRADMGNQ